MIIKYVKMHQAYKIGMTWIAWQTEIQNDVVRTSYWSWYNQNNDKQTKKEQKRKKKKGARKNSKILAYLAKQANNFFSFNCPQ